MNSEPKQNEMIQELELLRSKYGEGDDPYSSGVFAHRYRSISQTIVNQIDPELFDGTLIKGYGEGSLAYDEYINSIDDRFEPTDDEELITDGVIYKINQFCKQKYILTVIRSPSDQNRFYIMYGFYTNSQNIRWDSSGYDGFLERGNIYESMRQWFGEGDIARLKGYNFTNPHTRTLNFSRRGFQ